jgi:UDP-N-acetyl-D-glucosamine dehydrogenase
MPDAKRYLDYQHRTIHPPPSDWASDRALGWIGALADRFATRSARVAVVGLGYAGLPMALALAEAGFATIGLDQDAAKLARLAAGESGMRHVGPQALGDALQSQRFTVSGAWALLADADAVLICVPTPLGRDR